MEKKIIYSIGVLAILIITGYFLFFNQSTSVDIVSKPQTYSGDVSSLVLSLEELPEGYKIVERTPRTKSDVSDFGLNNGFQEGYYIRYLKGDEESLFDISRIEVYVSKYPLENVSKGIENGINEMEGYTAEALPNPNIGEGSMSTRYTDNEFGWKEYRVEFYSKDIYMTLIAGGSSTDYELLKELAQKIENKI
jgi:hypothetical protein